MNTTEMGEYPGNARVLDIKTSLPEMIKYLWRFYDSGSRSPEVIFLDQIQVEGLGTSEIAYCPSRHAFVVDGCAINSGIRNSCDTHAEATVWFYMFAGFRRYILSRNEFPRESWVKPKTLHWLADRCNPFRELKDGLMGQYVSSCGPAQEVARKLCFEIDARTVALVCEYVRFSSEQADLNEVMTILEMHGNMFEIYAQHRFRI